MSRFVSLSLIGKWNGTYGKDSVVREEEHVGDDVPSSVPRNVLLVEENAHQLNYSERRVSLQPEVRTTA